MSEPAFIEAMTRFVAKNGAIMRVWSRLPGLNAERVSFAKDLMEKFTTQLDPDRQYTVDELAAAVSTFRDDITAVEVTDAEGNGIVIYTEWP
jgi:hypothetical protein